jgi:RimJ/RimL family protein N-acetyltransferase
VFRAFFDDAHAKGGALAVVDTASDEVIGSRRVQPCDYFEEQPLEIGWSFIARAYWGKGYNAEMKRLMLAHAFRHVDRVVFRVGADNVISRGAMRNIGGRLTGTTFVEDRAGRPVEHVVYEITHEEFARGPLA